MLAVMLRNASVLVLLAMTALMPARAAAQGSTGSALQLVDAGMKALRDRRFDDAADAFIKATKLQPKDPRAWLGRGLAEYMMGRNDESAASLERALGLDPRLLDASLVLGQLQYASGHLSAAIASYEAALRYAPAEQRITEALAKWRSEEHLESRFYESRGAHFRVLFEGPADDALARRVVDMLEAAYWSVGATLSTYPMQTIDVVLYTQEQFRDVTRSPAWAAAAYDGRVRVPVRDALERPGDLERLLVHELVHAFVARLGGRSVPMWLNEGLAVALEPDGVEQSEKALATTTLRVSLAELHNGFGELSAPRARAAYAESALAVRQMLDLRGAAAVVALLADLANGVEFEAAFYQRIAMPYAYFQQLIARQ